MLPYILIILLVLASAFFYGTEMAIAHSNKFLVEENAKRGGKTARHVKYVVDNFTKSLSTILVGNDLVKTATSSLATIVALELFLSKGEEFATTIASLFTAGTLLIFGEILPKIIAKEHAMTYLKFAAFPFRILMICFAPIVWFVSFLLSLFSPLWKNKTKHQISEQELHVMVDELAEEGEISEAEGILLHESLEFADRTVSEILIPRDAIFAFDMDSDNLSDLFVDVPYSTIPVYRSNLENIVGVLSRKKLLTAALECDADRLNITEYFVDSVLQVKENETLLSLLDKMQTHKHRLVFATDESGTVTGLVTMSRLLAAIYGDAYTTKE